MMKRLKLKTLIPALLLPLGLGTAAALMTRDGMAVFAGAIKPPLSPPAWLFPIVWTVLYLLMGTASALVWSADVSPIRRDRALSFYSLSLTANFVWPLIFFGMELYAVAFFWLILLWLLSAAAALLFFYISPRAGRLMLPYILWLSFALYLNLGVWILN